MRAGCGFQRSRMVSAAASTKRPEKRPARLPSRTRSPNGASPHLRELPPSVPGSLCRSWSASLLQNARSPAIAFAVQSVTRAVRKLKRLLRKLFRICRAKPLASAVCAFPQGAASGSLSSRARNSIRQPPLAKYSFMRACSCRRRLVMRSIVALPHLPANCCPHKAPAVPLDGSGKFQRQELKALVQLRGPKIHGHL